MVQLYHTRKEAQALGLKRFFNGRSCPKGHNCERLVCSGKCVECLRIRNAERLPFRLKEEAVKQTYAKGRWKYKLRVKYGITPEQHKAMFIAQDFKCASCKSPVHNGHGWHTDHCHRTNVVRGILCSPCNLALGNVKDSIPRLKGLIGYLEKNKTRTIPEDLL